MRRVVAIGVVAFLGGCEPEYRELTVGTVRAVDPVPSESWYKLSADGHCYRLWAEDPEGSEMTLSLWLETDDPDRIRRADVRVTWAGPKRDRTARPFAMDKSVASTKQWDLEMVRNGRSDEFQDVDDTDGTEAGSRREYVGPTVDLTFRAFEDLVETGSEEASRVAAADSDTDGDTDGGADSDTEGATETDSAEDATVEEVAPDCILR